MPVTAQSCLVMARRYVTLRELYEKFPESVAYKQALKAMARVRGLHRACACGVYDRYRHVDIRNWWILQTRRTERHRSMSATEACATRCATRCRRYCKFVYQRRRFNITRKPSLLFVSLCQVAVAPTEQNQMSRDNQADQRRRIADAGRYFSSCL